MQTGTINNESCRRFQLCLSLSHSPRRDVSSVHDVLITLVNGEKADFPERESDNKGGEEKEEEGS